MITLTNDDEPFAELVTSILDVETVDSEEDLGTSDRALLPPTISLDDEQYHLITLKRVFVDRGLSTKELLDEIDVAFDGSESDQIFDVLVEIRPRTPFVTLCAELLMYCEHAIWCNEKWPLSKSDDLFALERIVAIRDEIVDFVVVDVASGGEVGPAAWGAMFSIGMLVQSLVPSYQPDSSLIRKLGEKNKQILDSHNRRQTEEAAVAAKKAIEELRKRHRETGASKTNILQAMSRHPDGIWGGLTTLKRYCIDVDFDE